MTCRFFERMKHLSFFAAVATAVPAAAETNELLFEEKSEESIRVRLKGDAEQDARAVVERQMVDYHHVALWGSTDGTPDRQVIARETLRQVQDDSSEEVESNLRVDLFFAKESHGKFPSKPTHTIEVPDAHEAEFEDTYWTATTLGCCDAEPYTRMYAYGSSTPFLRGFTALMRATRLPSSGFPSGMTAWISSAGKPAALSRASAARTTRVHEPVEGDESISTISS